MDSHFLSASVFPPLKWGCWTLEEDEEFVFTHVLLEMGKGPHSACNVQDTAVDMGLGLTVSGLDMELEFVWMSRWWIRHRSIWALQERRYSENFWGQGAGPWEMATTRVIQGRWTREGMEEDSIRGLQETLSNLGSPEAQWGWNCVKYDTEVKEDENSGKGGQRCREFKENEEIMWRCSQWKSKTSLFDPLKTDLTKCFLDTCFLINLM